MRISHIVIAVVAFVGLVTAAQTIYTVDQTEVAIVLQLGKPTGDTKGPGLHAKIPFIQNVVFFDSRLLEYDAKASEVLTLDKKNLVVDNYARWRITDPLLFYRTLRTVSRAHARLDDIIYAELRVALGQYTLQDVVSAKRAFIMGEVTKKSTEILSPYGLEVIDVRIKRTDLPPENAQAIYGRMRAERERQAKLYRSEGWEEMEKIKSGADKDRAVLLAEAERQAEVLRGVGDAEATSVWAGAVSQAPDFFVFTRSLEAYQKAMSQNTRIFLTPQSPFLKYLR
ncbi:HflC protein [Solidesulfovibrio carbinoliphilus subsp. oakridgensis]|uniref:Protein HflC n=1 Tax=Solidesulfovibrio carbinoliphilus subsp. oakridgensis TaxID=694327 RepID=G7Q4X5_9BACT|nr:protease modulator HflC [Solidesulfovibrio carbinoliphilus]EHJ47902.1 HflC protein [Solidesulfovibrio carbinoliphilus subsp. oakridgensis]